MVYKQEAILVQDGVPIFCPRQSEYVKNYDRIASKLILSLEQDGKNPYMEKALWEDAEIATADVLQKYLSAGCKILDVGCGTGRMLSYFDNVDKYGIDISIEMAKISREKGINACVGNVEDLPYKDGVFDIIICTDVLEHVFNLYQTLYEINRVGKNGAIIVLRVPQEEELSAYLSPEYPFKFVHLRMFSKSSLQLYCTKVFNMKFLEAKDAGNEMTEWHKKLLMAIPLIFTKIFLSLVFIIYPPIRNHTGFIHRFEYLNKRYSEIIEVFEKEN